MSKFGKFDEKETKEGNIRRIVSECLKMMRHDHVRPCEDEKTEEVIRILSELLTEKEAKDLLCIANYDKIVEKGEEVEYSGLKDKFWRESDENSDWEKFLKGFYYDVLPTVLLYDPHFDEVRGDFLRYFILWDNFSEEKSYQAEEFYISWIPKDSFEASKIDEKEKLDKFNDIKALCEYVAENLRSLRFIEPLDKKYYKTEMVYLKKKIYCNLVNGTTYCFFRVFKGLLNNITFLKTLIKDKLLTPEFVLDYMFRHDYFFKTFEIQTMCLEYGFRIVKEGENLESVRREEFEKYGRIVCESEAEFKALIEPKKGSIDLIFHDVTKEELAEILFSWDEMTAYLAEGKFIKKSVTGMSYEMKNAEFFSLMMKLDSGYKESLIKRVIEREVRKMGDMRYSGDLFANFGEALIIICSECCNNDDAVKSNEIRSFLLKSFLREKVLEDKYFKELPDLFQKLVIVQHTMDFFEKSADFSEVGIDKDALKKEVDAFLAELKKIAKSGGKPSAYYANEHFDSDSVPDSESEITTQAFHVAVSFLKNCFGPWKAVKPVLAIFRNLKEQAYAIDMKPYEDFRFVWAFVPLRLTPLLGSLEGEEAAAVCEEWFKYLAGELKSADDFAINKRMENHETLPEEFEKGYDIKVIEPHPLWREAYCEAAGDLRVNLGCKSVFNHLKKNDIDKDVQEAAAKTLERIGKIKGKFDSGSRKRALLNAWWWYRVAHLKSLGVDFDWVAAQNLKSKEVKINYPKNY